MDVVFVASEVAEDQPVRSPIVTSRRSWQKKERKHHYCAMLARFNSRSTISTNATAPNLPGPGRTLGLLLNDLGKRLELFINLLAMRRGLGPRAVAREIRLLRQHNKMSPTDQRTATTSSLSKRHMRELKKLCGKILKYSRSRMLATQLQALDEIVDLVTFDAVVRAIFLESSLDLLVAKYKEPDLITATARALSCVNDTKTHTIWSDLISQSQCVHEGIQLNDSYWASLKNSISDPETSFIAARYLPHTFLLKEAVGMVFDNLLELFVRYVSVASRDPGDVEWSTLSKCVKNFTSAYNHHPFLFFGNHFLTPRHIHSNAFAANMIQGLHHTLDFTSSYLTSPQIGFLQGAEGCELTFTYTYVRNWTLDDRAIMCGNFLTVLSGSYDLNVQLSCIRNLNVTAQEHLSSTVFAHEIFMAYCHLEHFFRPSLYKLSSSSSKWRMVLPGAQILSRYLQFDSSISVELRAVATFLAVKFASKDRYCKKVMDLGARHSSRPFLFTEEFAEHVKEVVGEGPSSSQAPFDIWWLLRSRVGGVCRHILNIEDICAVESIMRRYSGRDVRAEIMLNYTNTAMLSLEINKKTGPFRTTGHYPILAGYDDRGDELYVAFSVLTQSLRVSARMSCGQYATIKDGAASAAFTELCGSSHTIQRFRVPVLRHNPCDITSAHPISVHNQRLDPTGPLAWLKYWPEKDPVILLCPSENVTNLLKRLDGAFSRASKI
ncbi:hypothetical protein SCHPADRAFT_1002030 [Schizopora paradoxa]|uniref:Uncharacterized protein n=1 Tax=Schizopora paradoxa TaxID=27342 RepID=A0A0H2RBT0_9AGAM|nr:hypothetical protein SCHPADRAFT_1002030 [Schizopora paradoxa]